MQEVEVLKAQGLSVKEIEMENEGASAILEYLKEHERKLSEKKAVNKVIKENESKIQEVHDLVYGVPGKFYD